MRKETTVLNDNTTMTIEHTIGRCDITITAMIKGVLVSNGVIHVEEEPHEEKAFYWIELEKSEWVIRLCVNGFFYYNSVEIGRTMTKKDAIQTVIERHTSNHWYDFGYYGECFVTEFEAQSISKVIADYEQSAFVYVREYDDRHLKVYPNGYVFECESIEAPKNTIKSEEEEEAANEHFVKQMSESELEYMGVEYMDALQMDNWKKYLLDTLYGGEEKPSEIYIVVSAEYVVKGWFWNIKGAEQFHRLHGGKIIKVTSDLFYLQKICNLYQEIIRSFDIDGMSITSQLSYNGYRLSDKNSATFIFECLQEYCLLYETDVLFRKHFGINYSGTLSTYLKLTRNALDNKKDTEKTLFAFCKNMLYLTDYAIFEFLNSVMDKEGENNDNC